MFRFSLKFSLAISLLLSSTTGVSADSTNSDVLDVYIEAYNSHNIDGMLDNMSAGVRWMNIDGDELFIAATGKEEFRNVMQGYFEHFPTAKATITQSQSVGDFITTVEKASWVWEGAPRSQCAMAVYSFENNLIVNVWYHIAQPCSG